MIFIFKITPQPGHYFVVADSEEEARTKLKEKFKTHLIELTDEDIWFYSSTKDDIYEFDPS